MTRSDTFLGGSWQFAFNQVECQELVVIAVLEDNFGLVQSRSRKTGGTLDPLSLHGRKRPCYE